MKKISLLILLALSLSSCTHHYYMPAVKNVPLFKEKNEYRLSGSLSTSQEIEASELQAAYSVTNRFAVMANYMNASGGNLKSNDWGKGQYIEGAFGYYKHYKKNKVFQVFAGMGIGKQQHKYAESSYSLFGGGTSYYDIGSSDLSFRKYFIQPSIGYSNKIVDFAFTSGLGMLSFYTVNNNIKSDEQPYLDVDAIAKNRNRVLLENALTLRLGWNYVKVQFQFQTSHQLGKPSLKFEEGGASMGLSFAFADRFRRR
jgi:hypothetical protein